MVRTTTPQTLEHENAVFAGSGGISQTSHQCGFRPAFLDTRTETVYLACYRDGRPAPFHLLDGLPEELVLERNAGGGVAAVAPSIISGFVRNERFFTREEAARQIAHAEPRPSLLYRGISTTKALAVWHSLAAGARLHFRRTSTNLV